jgi:anti-anti-sigma factor
MLPTHPAWALVGDPDALSLVPVDPVEAEADADMTYLFLSGELDVSQRDAVAAALRRLLQRGPARIRVDLGAVTFLDAAIVNVLVDARRLATASGGDLLLRRVRGAPRVVLEAVRLDGVLLDESCRDG